MSLTLLLGTGLIVRSLLKLALTDPGFDPKGLLSVQVYLPTEKYMNDNDRTAFFGRVFQQLSITPGVRAVGGTSSFPIYAPTFFRPFRIIGAEDATADSPSEADINRTTSSYLPMVGIRLLEGRYFTVRDREGSEGAAIVDETFKRRFLRNQPAVGTVLSIDADSGVRKTFTIIGVVRNVVNVGNQYELGHPRPIVYVPFGQFASTTMTILAKTDGSAISLQPQLRRLLRSLDADLPIQDIRTVEDRIHETSNRSRQMVGVLGVFALSALVLCAIGIFGVVALSVMQRTREIGIRMALGALPGNVQLMFLRQGLVLASAGIGLGILGAFMLTRQIDSLLYGVRSNDILTYLGAAFTVMVVALSATYLPARRAAFVDPARVLRNE
jgi:putative ABC transport system permease protein